MSKKIAKDMTEDTIWYALITLLFFAGIFAVVGINGKISVGLWFFSLTAIQLLFKKAMNYSEID